MDRLLVCLDSVAVGGCEEEEFAAGSPALWPTEKRPRELPEFLRESRVNREQMRLVALALAGPALRAGVFEGAGGHWNLRMHKIGKDNLYLDVRLYELLSR